MSTNTIKALYKAVTTNKAYIVTEDISTNYLGYKYMATNNLLDKYMEFPYSTIATAYYYDNLGQLELAYKDMMDAWTKQCYYYEWDKFLEKYELTQSMVSKIKSSLKRN